MVSTLAAVGFGDVLTSDPTFGVPAFLTLVSPILNVGIALEWCCTSSCAPKAALRKRPDWSRPLPQPLVIPGLMTLATLADMRTLLDHVPAEHREQENWRYVATKLDEAARGASVVEVFALLRTVLAMEGIAYRPQ